MHGCMDAWMDRQIPGGCGGDTALVRACGVCPRAYVCDVCVCDSVSGSGSVPVSVSVCVVVCVRARVRACVRARACVQYPVIMRRMDGRTEAVQKPAMHEAAVGASPS